MAPMTTLSPSRHLRPLATVTSPSVVFFANAVSDLWASIS
jgi:hypothetical protein